MTMRGGRKVADRGCHDPPVASERGAAWCPQAALLLARMASPINRPACGKVSRTVPALTGSRRQARRHDEAFLIVEMTPEHLRRTGSTVVECTR
jgi:hypothetical protein